MAESEATQIYFFTFWLLAVFCVIKFSPADKWVLTVSGFLYVGTMMNCDEVQTPIFTEG